MLSSLKAYPCQTRLTLPVQGGLDRSSWAQSLCLTLQQQLPGRVAGL